jgi:hypothetical protein
MPLCCLSESFRKPLHWYACLPDGAKNGYCRSLRHSEPVLQVGKFLTRPNRVGC